MIVNDSLLFGHGDWTEKLKGSQGKFFFFLTKEVRETSVAGGDLKMVVMCHFVSCRMDCMDIVALATFLFCVFVVEM